MKCGRIDDKYFIESENGEERIEFYTTEEIFEKLKKIIEKEI